MLKLNEFRHNHYFAGVKMLAKHIRVGISVIDMDGVLISGKTLIPGRNIDRVINRFTKIYWSYIFCTHVYK